MNLLNTVKLMLNLSNTSKDSIISALIESCKAEFKNYCKVDTISELAEYVIIDMVVCRYNKLGAEGLSSQGFSGVSESYIEDYPINIKNSMNAFRKVQFL